MVDHHVAHQAQEPGARRAARDVVTLCATPDTEERLLHGVLRQIRIARDSQREAVGKRRDTVVELPKRALVAAGHAAQESGLDVDRVCHGSAR